MAQGKCQHEMPTPTLLAPTGSNLQTSFDCKSSSVYTQARMWVYVCACVFVRAQACMCIYMCVYTLECTHEHICIKVREQLVGTSSFLLPCEFQDRTLISSALVTRTITR